VINSKIWLKRIMFIGILLISITGFSTWLNAYDSCSAGPCSGCTYALSCSASCYFEECQCYCFIDGCTPTCNYPIQWGDGEIEVYASKAYCNGGGGPGQGGGRTPM